MVIEINMPMRYSDAEGITGDLLFCQPAIAISGKCALWPFMGCGRIAGKKDPDLVTGELRDQQRQSYLAFDGGETGHLVLATVHTRGARSGLNDWMFPAQEKDLSRKSTWQVVTGVLSAENWKWINRKDGVACLNC